MYVSMYVCTHSSRLIDATAGPNPCVVYFKEEKNKLFSQAITRGPSVSMQGAFDSCSLVFDRKGKLLAIAFSYMVMQDLGSIKWCSLINTKTFPFLGHVVQPKDSSSSVIPAASNSLTYGDVTTCSWTLQLPCSHPASLSAFVSHISFTHPIFPELLIGFNLNCSVISQTVYQ